MGGVGGGGIQIAEKGRQEERGRRKRRVVSCKPERSAEGWRLRAAARREAGRISAGAERERRTERGVCASWMYSAASLTD